MRKRIVSVLLAVVLVVGLALPSLAVEPRASEYVQQGTAALTAGSQSGTINLSYYVRTLKTEATEIGVSRIAIFNDNGSVYQVIYGTVANGWLKSSGSVVNDTRALSCISGNTYYAQVTMLVKDANGSGTRTVKTNSVVCP